MLTMYRDYCNCRVVCRGAAAVCQAAAGGAVVGLASGIVVGAVTSTGKGVIAAGVGFIPGFIGFPLYKLFTECRRRRMQVQNDQDLELLGGPRIG